MAYLLIFLLIVSAALIFLAMRRKKVSSVDFSVLPDEFVIFDLETTGLKPEVNEIIEIAALKVNARSPSNSSEQVDAESFQVLVKPSKSIPKKISELTGITQKELDERGRPLEEAIDSFLSFIGNAPLVAYNADFDMSFLRAAVGKLEGGRALKSRVACALVMSRKAWPGLENYKLQTLAAKVGLETADSHRALADAQRALVIYVHAATALGTSGH